MSSFCQELVQCNPKIEIREQSSRFTLDGVVPSDRQNPKKRQFPKATPRWEKNKDKFPTDESLRDIIVKRTFTSTDSLPGHLHHIGSTTVQTIFEVCSSSSSLSFSHSSRRCPWQNKLEATISTSIIAIRALIKEALVNPRITFVIIHRITISVLSLNDWQRDNSILQSTEVLWESIDNYFCRITLLTKILNIITTIAYDRVFTSAKVKTCRLSQEINCVGVLSMDKDFILTACLSESICDTSIHSFNTVKTWGLRVFLYLDLHRPRTISITSCKWKYEIIVINTICTQ
jgi:hypothetical protein